MIFEAEVAPGLEAIAQRELEEGGATVTYTASGSVQFTFKGAVTRLLELKTVNAVYVLRTFHIPRPKALLGHQHFTALVSMIQAAQSSDTFQSLNIDAAGAESSVMQRLKGELASAAKLEPVQSKGDLLIRFRPSKSKSGWDALVRLTARPLATRKWRVQNFEGALNASVAHAMIRLTQPSTDDNFLNLCCGSGTILIERMTQRAKIGVGCDIDTTALSYTKINASAANLQPNLLQADVTRLPFTSNTFNKLCADLPFGQLVGSHQNNVTLYPALLHEAARVAVPDARLVVITHEIRLIEKLLSSITYWHTEQTLKITLNGLHPRIYVLRRTAI
jgi:tRNA (guanine6-N2)-methyltransferase